MSDSKTEALDPKKPMFEPEPPKKRGRKPAPEVIEYKMKKNPYKTPITVKFTCYRCTMEVDITGFFYTKPYCAHCHIEMARDKK